MKKAGLYCQIDPAVWKRDWVIDSKAVGDGKQSLAYMARYLFRVAISNRRIVAVTDGNVVFRYKTGEFGARKWKTASVDVFEFMRRFLQHVLPTGFMKVRHYGFLNGNFSLSIEKIRSLVYSFLKIVRASLPVTVLVRPSRPRCPRCKEIMNLVRFCPAVRWEVPPG